jgi:hypothetical protein
MEWDVFISHARPDRESVARPLAERLRQAGLKVWLDQGELQLGDSLRSKIDEGLAHSRFGVVVLSKAFFAAQWPQRELSGLVTRESHGHPTILPVLHNIDRDVVAQNSPVLANLMAINTSEGLERVAAAVLRAAGTRASADRSDYSTSERREGFPAVVGAPPPPAVFVGRDYDLAHLKHRLLAPAGLRPSGTTVVIQGLPGVGKTALASAICHDPQVSAAFMDGVFWASLGQAPDLLSLLMIWGRTLEVVEVGVAADMERARTLLATRLKQARALFVLNDVWAAEDAQALMVGGPASATLITTRMPAVAEALGGSPHEIYSLDVLSEDASLELLRTLAPDAVARRDDAITLVRELEGLPLAVNIAGRLLHSGSSQRSEIQRLLKDLRNEIRLLRSEAPRDTKSGTEELQTSVAALLNRSTGQLTPEARHALAFLGVFAPKPATFDLEALKAVWNVADPRPLAQLLVDHGLLEPVGNGRFHIHRLVREHARSLLLE